MRRAKGSGQSNLGIRGIFHVQGLPAHGPSRAASSMTYMRVANVRTASWISVSVWRDDSSTFQLPLPLEYANLTWLGGISS